MDTRQILQLYSSDFNLDTILGRIIRELLWSIVKILGYIVDAITTVVSKLFVLDSFYNNPNVINFISSFKPLIVVLFAISFCTVGYQLMFSQTKQFRKIGINVLIAITVILVLPMAMSKMNALTNTGVTAVIGKTPDLTNQIIKENIVDLLLYDKLNFDSGVISKLNSNTQIDVKNIRYIDPTALIEPNFFNSMKVKNQDVFKNSLTVDVNGVISKQPLNQSWMTYWKDYYYRYSINFLIIIVSLGVIGATLAFTCFKLGTLIFELGYNKLLAILVAPADISNGQRTKQIIQNILSIFIVTFLIAVLLKFYVLFIGAVADIKGIQSMVLLVAGSFAVIEGPNIVEKLFGVDAGLHSGFKTMAGAYLTGKAITGGARKLGNTAKSIASPGGRVVGSVVGGSAGMINGLRGKNKKSDSMYSDMKNGKENLNNGISLYSDMNKKGADPTDTNGSGKKTASKNTTEPRHTNGNKGSNNKSGSARANIVSKDRSDPINTRNKGSNTKSINKNVSKKPASLYSEMKSNSDNEISGHTVTDITPEYVTESNPEPIQSSGSVTSPYDNNDQTTGQYVKNKIKAGAQHNSIYKQTMKSYNLGRNIAQDIRDRSIKKKNK